MPRQLPDKRLRIPGRMAAEKAIHLETIRTSVKLSVNFAIGNVASTVVTAAIAIRAVGRGAPC